MKKNSIIFFVLTMLISNGFAQKEAISVMVLKGVYSGKNIFVKSPICTNEKGFSIRGIKINGDLSPVDFMAVIFEISFDLSGMNIHIGDSVKVEIFYITNCPPRNKPSIMNPGALLTSGNISARKENTLIVEGQFYWGNLFVMNKYNTATKSYSIKEVLVNGKPVKNSINKDIFQIDLASLGFIEGQREGLKEGDKITIEFKYDKDNGPFIINPEVIEPFN